jgi:hypothetical protein
LLEDNNDAFLQMARDPDMSEMLEAAFTNFMSNMKGGNGSKQADYEEICRKYEMAKAKKKAEGPFTEQCTPGEERLIKKFESMRDENNGPYETHYPNQNAVTYVYLCAKMMVAMNVPRCNDEQLFSIMSAVFKFIGLHGGKSVVTFVHVINKYEDITINNFDFKPLFQNLINSDHYKVSSADSPDNKLLDNKFLTLKRMYRMVHIFTKEPTQWGLLDQNMQTMKTGLKELWRVESALNASDSFALSIVWYMCIGRRFISCVMVDHHEKSTYRVLCDLLGKPPKSGFTMPRTAFPLDKSPEDNF